MYEVVLLYTKSFTQVIPLLIWIKYLINLQVRITKKKMCFMMFYKYCSQNESIQQINSNYFNLVFIYMNWRVWKKLGTDNHSTPPTGTVDVILFLFDQQRFFTLLTTGWWKNGNSIKIFKVIPNSHAWRMGSECF